MGSDDSNKSLPTEPFSETGPAVPTKLRLIVLSGSDRGSEIELNEGTYRIGQAPDCDLVLKDRAVSRYHLKIEMRTDGVRVYDLESKNGSFFEGARFSHVTVGAGAVFKIGATELRLVTIEKSRALLPSTRQQFGGLAGRSLAMREVFALLERLAPADAPLLIEGETGTGKELCAEAIHAASARAKGPFVVCDLASVAGSLIESELFGHRRGAFTGADRDRDGCFALAHQGTLFIDELGELEPDLQPRLLRAIEQRKIKPVGGSDYQSVDVRIIAATNRDLQEECKAGRFRADLYHRLAVLCVHLPPLRERKEDVPLLVEQFLAGHPIELDVDAMALLTAYDWPGNVRELKNTIDRALPLLGQGTVLAAEHLRSDARTRPGDSGKESALLGDKPFREAKEEQIVAWERSYLNQLIGKAAGNISEAARRGGIDRPYLYRLLRKHGLYGDGD